MLCVHYYRRFTANSKRLNFYYVLNVFVFRVFEWQSPESHSKRIGFIRYNYCTLYMNVLCLCAIRLCPKSICITQPTANGHRILQADFIFQFTIFILFLYSLFFCFFVLLLCTRHSALDLCFGLLIHMIEIPLDSLHDSICAMFNVRQCYILIHSPFLSIYRIRQQFN